MKPFYSVEDLMDMFDFATSENIADALDAAQVPMIFAGKPADLAGWHNHRTRRDEAGVIYAVRGGALQPDPDEVMVSYEQLPESWRQHINAYELAEKHEAHVPTAATEKSQASRRTNNLLRIIKALIVKADIPKRGAATVIEMQLEELGFQSPKYDTISTVLVSVNALDPD